MSWNYRVVRREHKGEVQYGIHEAYFGATSWTETPVEPVADSVDELRDVLAKMTAALDRPVIDVASEQRRNAVVEAAREHAKYAEARIPSPVMSLKALMGAVAALDELKAEGSDA